MREGLNRWYAGNSDQLQRPVIETLLEKTMIGAKTLEAQIADGTAKVAGDVGILKKFAATMVDFNPRFEIMPGTKLTEPKPTEHDAFEVEVGPPMAE